MQAKSWFRSRTLWVNFIALVLAVIVAFTGIDPDPQVKEGAVIIVALVNVFLRLVTSQSIGR